MSGAKNETNRGPKYGPDGSGPIKRGGPWANEPKC